MGIVNVKIGSLEIPMDLESEHDLRSNIQYIGKVFGFSPKQLRNRFPSSVAGPAHLGLKYDLRMKGEVASFPGGLSLKNAGVQEYLARAGEGEPGAPLTHARTIEFFEPGNPELQPPYPLDRFGESSIPIREKP